MEALELYHRSFVDVTDQKKYKENAFGEDRITWFPATGSVSGFQWLPKAFRPIDLYPKPGQNYKNYATDWEVRCSILLSQSGLMRPVVDQNETTAGFPVVAHYGRVPASNIIVPREHVKRGDDEKWVQKLVEREVPAYVTSMPYPDAGDWRSLVYPNSVITHFTVLTDLEGRILAQLGASLKDDSIQSADPLSYLMVGKLIVALGRGVGKRIISAMRRKPVKGAGGGEGGGAGGGEISSLEKARQRWGQAAVHDGSAKAAANQIELAKQTMQRTMPQIVDQATNNIAFKTFQQFHNSMSNAGFKVIKVEKFGPDGGYQIFYQNGNVVGRFKTLGDAAGPRMGKTHISFSLTDGKGLQWMNDMAKFNANGKLAPKNIVDPKRFDPAKDFQGNPHRFPVVESKFDIKVVDSWANSTHFNAPAGFDLRGVGDTVRGLTQ